MDDNTRAVIERAITTVVVGAVIIVYLWVLADCPNPFRDSRR